MDELKRCSCGGEPEIYTNFSTYYAICLKCGKCTKRYSNAEDATKEWNTSTRRPSHHKYRPGPKITSLNELMEQEFVYWHGKITHHSWFCNWQLRMANQAIKRGILRQAIKIESEDNMTNIIKLRFLHDGKPKGREYTYFTPVPVAIGNTVDIDGHKHGIVTAADVPEEKIATFRDRMKTIVGLALVESEESV